MKLDMDVQRVRHCGWFSPLRSDATQLHHLLVSNPQGKEVNREFVNKVSRDVRRRQLALRTELDAAARDTQAMDICRR